MALAAPGWLLRWRFGLCNRPTRTYDGLVARYKEKLAQGGKAAGAFVPPAVAADAVVDIGQAIQRSIARIDQRMDRWSDGQLDTLLLPHPLLGKLTLREMLYFTIHHVQHHRALVERDRHTLQHPWPS